MPAECQQTGSAPSQTAGPIGPVATRSGRRIPLSRKGLAAGEPHRGDAVAAASFNGKAALHLQRPDDLFHAGRTEFR